MSGLRPPKQLAINSELDMSQEWAEWIEIYENYYVAAKLDTEADAIQAANFISAIGRDALKIINSLGLTAAQKKSYKEVKEKLENYFTPSKNKTFERSQFHRIKQQANEPFDEFLLKLRTQVKRCAYPEAYVDEFIMDQIVLGIYAEVTRQKLWTEEDLNLDRTIKICRAAERAEKQINDITSNTMVCAVKTDKFFNCKRCGRKHGYRACPAFDKSCETCGRKGHFKVMCKSNSKKYKKSKMKKQHNVRAIDGCKSNNESDSNDDLVVHSVQKNSETTKIKTIKSKDDRWTVKLQINDANVQVQLDTGADCCVLPLKQAQRIGAELKSSTTKWLSVYGNGRLAVIGEIKTICKNKTNVKPVIFKVVKENLEPILGREMCGKLGFIKRIYKVDDGKSVKTKEIGCCKNFEYDIDFIDDPKFKIIPARKIPHGIRDRVKKELDKMVEMKIIEPVSEPSPAVSPILIVERGKKLRICMDPTELNKNIKRRHYPLKTVEEIAVKVKGAKHFTKLDCEKGFWQLKVTKRTSGFLAIATPWGRYRYLRLPFGISSAPEIFSEVMNRTLDNISGCEIAMDDILIHAKTKQQLLETTNLVLGRLREAGFTLNSEKCEYDKQRIKFLGHIFTPHGCEPDEEKLAAIEQLKAPTCRKEVQRVMGMINYIGKFIPNLSEMTEPIRRLLVKDVEWHWDSDQQKSFDEIKKTIKSVSTLQFYDVNKPVKLSVDASSFAMGCCLMQDDRPIAYATKAFTKNQQIYPQIVKEAMAIRFGCKKFHEYVYGKQLWIETDHKPLETIFKKSITTAPMRLQKILWDVLPYTPSVSYVKGAQIPVADTLSRDCKQTEEESEESYQISTILSITDQALQRYVKATEQDTELRLLKAVIERGWPESIHNLPDTLKKYATFREELVYENGLLFKGNRVIVPKTEINRFLKQIHIGHPGITCMLSRARNYAFWIGQSADIKNFVEKCVVCQRTQRTNVKEPALMKTIPNYPFQLVSSDIFKFRGSDYLLIADHYSGFMDFRKLKSSTSSETIWLLKQWFSVHGIPEIFESDGGPQYTSRKFKEFSIQWEFEHRISSPHYPKSNGFAERNVQTIKNLLKKCHQDGTDVYMALLLLRNTDRNEVLKSPARRLFSRATRSIVPIERKKLYPKVIGNVTEELTNLRLIQKHYYDKVTLPAEILKTGDKVRMQVGHRDWIGAKVVQETKHPRSVIVETSNGRRYRRNNHHLHKTKADIRCSPSVVCSEQQPTTIKISTDQPDIEAPVNQSRPEVTEDSQSKTSANVSINTGQFKVSRYGRTIKPPKRFTETY